MPDLKMLSTAFVSILLEALPFVLLGAIVSSAIQYFISKEWIEKILPKKRWIGLFVAAVVGLIFPVCECTIIPVTRRLIKKGIPAGMAMTFMLCVPIINPVVLLSTYVAFNQDWVMTLARASFGIVGAIAIGFCIEQENYKEDILKEKYFRSYSRDTLTKRVNKRKGIARASYTSVNQPREVKPGRLKEILEHTSYEFIDITKYLLFGAFLTAIFQLYVDKQMIVGLSQKPYLMVGAMMFLAFILSICSEVDAFIGRTFIPMVGTGPVMAFLVFGPMLDLKNLMMLFGSFKTKFTLKLVVYIILINFLLGLVATILWL